MTRLWRNMWKDSGQLKNFSRHWEQTTRKSSLEEMMLWRRSWVISAFDAPLFYWLCTNSSPDNALCAWVQGSQLSRCGVKSSAYCSKWLKTYLFAKKRQLLGEHPYTTTKQPSEQYFIVTASALIRRSRQRQIATTVGQLFHALRQKPSDLLEGGSLRRISVPAVRH